MQKNNRRLDGWKEISSYLGKSLSTTHRLEQNGLPIRRLPGKSSVFAFTSEIDQWLLSGNQELNGHYNGESNSAPTNNGKEHRQRPRFVTRILLPILLMVIIALALSFALREQGHSKLHYEIRSYPKKSIIDVMTEEKEILFSLETENTYLQQSGTRGQKFAILEDVDEDGLPDLIFLDWRLDDKSYVRIYNQNTSGEFPLNKTWELNLTYAWNKHQYETFCPIDMELFDLKRNGQKMLAVAQNSTPYSPSVLQVFTLSGQERYRIFHPGHISNILAKDIDEDGLVELYVSGTNNRLEDRCSVPIAMKLEFLNQIDNFREFTFFNMDFVPPTRTPHWLKATYISLKKDRTDNRVSPYEISLVQAAQFGPNSSKVIRLLGSMTRYNIFGELDSAGPFYARALDLDKNLNVIDAFYLDPYLKAMNRTSNDPEIRDLLRPVFWNGNNWQDKPCTIPQIETF